MGKGEGGGSAVLERPLKLWSLVIDSVMCGGVQTRKKSKLKRGSHSGSEKLSELLKQPEWWDKEEEKEVRRKEQVLEGLKNVARKLMAAEGEEAGESAAADVRRLTKDDPHARTTLALLGVIPPLLALLDAADPSFRSQIAALYALLNLAITNDANKAAIVKAGGIHKMLKLIESGNRCIADAVVANFLGLSALDSNKSIIGCSGAIPFLVETLTAATTPPQAKQDSLRALYNLSISPASNVVAMLETDLIPYLLSKVGDLDMDMSERILSILGNVVSVAEGRKRISGVADAFPILMDVLNWNDSPGCQEKATYILMVMAHKSYRDRQAMIEAGIVSSLLELTLLGTTLAQKRASRMLECFKGKQLLAAAAGRGGGGNNMSAPLSLSMEELELESSSLSLSSTLMLKDDDDDDDDEMMMSQENKAVKQLVQQSLHNNMSRMVKRANLPHDFVPSHHLRSLTSSSTSKSLPF